MATRCLNCGARHFTGPAPTVETCKECPQQVRISTLELARVRYPNGRVTSGAGQDYMRRLDKIFQSSGFRALLHPRPWASGPLLTDLDDTQAFNLTEAEARQVIRQ